MGLLVFGQLSYINLTASLRAVSLYQTVDVSLLAHSSIAKLSFLQPSYYSQ